MCGIVSIVRAQGLECRQLSEAGAENGGTQYLSHGQSSVQAVHAEVMMTKGCRLRGVVDPGSYVGGSTNREPQSRPQYVVILIIRTPKKGPPFVTKGRPRLQCKLWPGLADISWLQYPVYSSSVL